jgi:hypothetical protein
MIRENHPELIVSTAGIPRIEFAVDFVTNVMTVLSTVRPETSLVA